MRCLKGAHAPTSLIAFAAFLMPKICITRLRL